MLLRFCLRFSIIIVRATELLTSASPQDALLACGALHTHLRSRKPELGQLPPAVLDLPPPVKAADRRRPRAAAQLLLLLDLLLLLLLLLLQGTAAAAAATAAAAALDASPCCLGVRAWRERRLVVGRAVGLLDRRAGALRRRCR